MYNVSLKGGTCMTGSWGTVIVDAVHEYSWDIFPVVLIVIFFHMGLGKGGSCVWDEESLDHGRESNMEFVDHNYLADVEQPMHLIGDWIADVEKPMHLIDDWIDALGFFPVGVGVSEGEAFCFVVLELE